MSFSTSMSNTSIRPSPASARFFVSNCLCSRSASSGGVQDGSAKVRHDSAPFSLFLCPKEIREPTKLGPVLRRQLLSFPRQVGHVVAVIVLFGISRR